jgi:CBS domain-containing protein
MAERLIGSMHIGEVRRLILENPVVITAERPLDELFQKMVEEPRTRRVYVVDGNGILEGSVRLYAVLRQLFPLVAATASGSHGTLEVVESYGATTVRDIMDAGSPSVRAETTVNEAVRLMISDGTNELPVVDDEGRVVGEVSFLEIVTAYLKAKRGR